MSQRKIALAGEGCTGLIIMEAVLLGRQNVIWVVAIFAGITCCYGQFNNFPPPPPQDSSGGAIAAVICVIFVIGGAVLCCVCVIDERIKSGIGQPRQYANPPPDSGKTVSEDGPLNHLKTLQFTFAEVLEITNKFRVKLGKGGFGAVYYGKLTDGKQVAVKRLSAASQQGVDEFLNEVEILSRVHHKNLVSLVGYCSEANERILLYEFMAKGTLEDHLHGLPSEQEPLDWLARLSIAVGAAHGFVYLHNHCCPAIIHRDVKSSNILLDGNSTAKVGDFGLSKLVVASATHVTTGVKGTIGYIDPEYAQTKRLTEKSDVYSFGIILLELISGNKVLTQSGGYYRNIVEWARPYIENKTIENIIDKKMTEIANKDSIQKVGELALQCAASQSIHRPPFDEVVQVLEQVHRTERRDWMRYDGDVSSKLSTSYDESVKVESIVPILNNTD